MRNRSAGVVLHSPPVASRSTVEFVEPPGRLAGKWPMTSIARAYTVAGLLVAAAAPCLAVSARGVHASGIHDQETEPTLRASVRPRIGYAPAVVIIEVLVEPASENRYLDFVVDSGDYYRSSRIELTGAAAPRVSVVEFRAVPAGTYDVLISMSGETGKVRARLHDRFVVTCPAGRCQ